MAEYVNAPIPVDADELEEQSYDAIRTQFPDWEASEGNLDVRIIKAFATIVATIGEDATDVTDTIFRYFGAELAGLPPIDATAATGATEWTLIDTDGHTIPAGTVIGVDNGEQLIEFQTVSDAVISSGDSTATGVDVVAVEAGEDGNDLTGDCTLIDPLDYVDTVTLTSSTSGGTEEESDDDYLNRLTELLRLLTPRPILPDDFAVLAKNVAGVGRATAINGYNPADSTYDNERMITVAVADEDGAALSNPVKTAVDQYLSEQREVNFVVNVIDPTYNTIDVTFTAVAWSTADPATVETDAEAAVADYLSPATWGRSQEGNEGEWNNRTVIRYLELAAVLDNVSGLDYVTGLTLEGGTADVTMTGVAPLPQPGTISGTVT